MKQSNMNKQEIVKSIENLERSIKSNKQFNKEHKKSITDNKAHIVEYKKEIEELRVQLEELPKYEAGKWYWADCSKDMEFLMLLESQPELKAKCYIVNDGYYEGGIFDNIIRPATDKEAEEALIKEAKKRGFKEGVEYNDIEQNGSKGALHVFKDNVNWVYRGEIHNDIRFGIKNMGWLFRNGKWATIIKDKTVTLNGDYTKVQLTDVINNRFEV